MRSSTLWNGLRTCRSPVRVGAGALKSLLVSASPDADGAQIAPRGPSRWSTDGEVEAAQHTGNLGPVRRRAARRRYRADGRSVEPVLPPTTSGTTGDFVHRPARSRTSAATSPRRCSPASPAGRAAASSSTTDHRSVSAATTGPLGGQRHRHANQRFCAAPNVSRFVCGPGTCHGGRLLSYQPQGVRTGRFRSRVICRACRASGLRRRDLDRTRS